MPKRGGRKKKFLAVFLLLNGPTLRQPAVMRVLIATVTTGRRGPYRAAAKANRVEDLPFRLEQLIGSTAAAVCKEAWQRADNMA